MIISPFNRLLLYVLVPVLPIVGAWLKTSSDFSIRGFAILFFECSAVAVAVILARTNSPAVDNPIQPPKPVDNPQPPDIPAT